MMYSIFESVINRGGYKLSEMLERIRMYAAEGRLTMNERDSLEKLAREHASVQDGIDMLGMLLEHEQRIRALELKVSGVEEAPPADNGGDTVIAEYVPGKVYYAGNVVSWNGKTYTCSAPEGTVCVWSPDEYPVYWELISE
jgi:hypothetical protein